MLTSASHDHGRPAVTGLPGNQAHGGEPARLGAGLKYPAPVRNELLSVVPPGDLTKLLPQLERVPLRQRQVLQERNLPVSHVYFIEQGAASLLSRAGERGTVEVGFLGFKDLAGIPAVLGTVRSPHRCVVLVQGEALRIRTDDLAKAMDLMPSFRQLLLGYVQATMVASAQLVVCGARHGVQERLARWLLVAGDRLGRNDFPVTHQTLSRALGVRRASVTTAVGRLEEAGLLRRGRSKLVVEDGQRLEEAACECHRAIRSEHHRLIHARSGVAPNRTT